MNRSYRVLYLLALLLALVPPGIRFLWWQKTISLGIDPAMAQAGETLFRHDWQAKDSLTPEGDGLGPVFNDTSCVACHNQGGAGGGGGLDHNVTTFTVRLHGQKARQGVVHANGLTARETLTDVHPELPSYPSRPLDGSGCHTTDVAIIVCRSRPALACSNTILN